MTSNGPNVAPWLVAGAAAYVAGHGRLVREHRELARLQAFTAAIGVADPLEVGLRELRRLLPVGAAAVALVASDGHLMVRSNKHGVVTSLRLRADELPVDLGREVMRISANRQGVLSDVIGHLGGRRGLAVRSTDSSLTKRYIVVAERPGRLGALAPGTVRLFGVAASLLDVRLHADRSWERLESEALIDSVTGLANRQSLEATLDHRLIGPRGAGALLTLRLQGFSAVNDSLGHRLGDDLLRAVAARLHNQVREGDLAARLGGDEFAVMFDEFPSGEELERRVIELAAQVDQPVDLGGLMLELPVSIGVVRWPTTGGTSRELLRQADIARCEAKRTDRQWACYRPAAHLVAADRLTLTGQLREAIDREQFEIHLQPQVRTCDRSLVGAEALLRWNHPTLGLVSPGSFLPPTEYSSIARELTRLALAATVDAAGRLLALERDLVLSMNLTNRDLLDGTLPGAVAAATAAGALGRHRLGFEVTESSLIVDVDAAVAGLTALRDLGCRTSVDDFGTGFASLRYIQLLPLDEVKIDRSFVSRAAVDANDAAIVRSTTRLMQDLGLEVVAEGVEDEATFALIREIGCDITQGYAVGRPLPVEEFVAFASRLG